MSTFYPEFEGLPSEDEISEYLATAGCDDLDTDRRNPYPATDRPRPSWRGGPPLDDETELQYRREQDDDQ